MILVTEIDRLIEWVNENRTDKESDKPYFIEQVDESGNYLLPMDALIEQGLKELNQEYSIILDFRGIGIVIESSEL